MNDVPVSSRRCPSDVLHRSRRKPLAKGQRGSVPVAGCVCGRGQRRCSKNASARRKPTKGPIGGIKGGAVRRSGRKHRVRRQTERGSICRAQRQCYLFAGGCSDEDVSRWLRHGLERRSAEEVGEICFWVDTSNEYVRLGVVALDSPGRR